MTEREGCPTTRLSAAGARSECQQRVDELIGSMAEFALVGRDNDAQVLREIARVMTATLIETEMHGEPQEHRLGEISRHPDYPVILARRVLAALHVLGELERSTEASLLAGLVARHLLLDGTINDARDLAVLALDLSCRTGGSVLGPVLGVLAASLSRCGHAREATEVIVVMRDGGFDPSDWRDIHAWVPGLASRDGAESSARPPVEVGAHGTLPGSLFSPLEDLPRAVWADAEWLDGLERFGLHRHRRLHRLTLNQAILLLRELEDEAVQREWLVG